ncbi:hypothetical protein [Bifidobacterium sp. ESL0764]|uniref:hypothetical protein n=1 Tax=Bifidobacterium sp. ESL0764 TaxID=2983228 RepID=UPI0023F7A737|nr:hypothetical protein [Bifidobacterium sp. ESL0764]WEV65764.1 hypothetical protein OZX71_08485 [Bifidobacterium sp. ESL0764]
MTYYDLLVLIDTYSLVSEPRPGERFVAEAETETEAGCYQADYMQKLDKTNPAGRILM